MNHLGIKQLERLPKETLNVGQVLLPSPICPRTAHKAEHGIAYRVKRCSRRQGPTRRSRWLPVDRRSSRT